MAKIQTSGACINSAAMGRHADPLCQRTMMETSRRHLVVTCCLMWLCFFANTVTTRRVFQRSSPDGEARDDFDTEQSDVTVVTQNGTVESIHIHEEDTEEEEDGFGETLHNNHSTPRKEDDDMLGDDGRGGLGRDRRMMDQGSDWPKGIVPYDLHWDENLSETMKKEVLAAMTKYHRYTCIRFVPWEKGVTKEKYQLPTESRVKFWKNPNGGCSAVQGYSSSNDGQVNSCCWRGSCVHELGHSLGLWHEHQNPFCDDFMKRDWTNLWKDWTHFYRARRPTWRHVYQYDATSTMHYSNHEFRILYEDLYDLKSLDNEYYMYKDVSRSHKCKERHCSDFSQECHNGGFVTLVQNKCSCLCPPHLDPATGCATVIKQVKTSSQWPKGSYALLSTKNGCPGNNVFSTGSWAHKGKGGNAKSELFGLAGKFESDVFQYEFCVKGDNSAEESESEWDPGRYCILKAGGSCPKGFESGSIQFDDADDSPQTKTGSLPDGDFGKDTRLEFCCRDDGFLADPLVNIPNTESLVLFHAQGKDCQEVAGMRWTEQFIHFASFPELAAINGRTAHVTADTKFKIWFCHYTPLITDCGGEVLLTKDKPTQVITSPGYPAPYKSFMECTWLIKAPSAHDRVLLNFDDMKISTKDGDCKDSLEIRYNMPGQPGFKYCGKGYQRTIRSFNETIIVTMRTDHLDATEDIGFKATASLFTPAEDECFDPQTKGKLYRGTKDLTRNMKRCMDWSEVTNCPHHAYNPRDFGLGLEKNYCRNPDSTAMPWCYTNSKCNRDYCDVCNVERIYDRTTVCGEQICQLPRQEILNQGCARFCKLEFSQPARDATCGPPGKVPDAEISAGEGGDKVYKVGDTVTYTCKTGSETLIRTCLSEGQWSPAGYVCGGCKDGWAYYKGACYKYFHLLQDFSKAQSTCKSHGALMASMKDADEQDVVSRLRTHVWDMWIGLTDIKVEGQFLWEDGTLVNFTNWDNNEPNNYRNQDCVESYHWIYKHQWNTDGCSDAKTFVCKYTLSEKQSCVDRLPDCSSVLSANPETCSAHLDFADQMCPHLCGVCEPDSTPSCKTDLGSNGVTLVRPEGQSSVKRGAHVSYTCKEGLVLTEGTLSLACGKDGNFIGQLPKCADPSGLVTDSNDVELKQRGSTVPASYSFTSVGAQLSVSRYGAIKKWKYYSPSRGWVIFQVWRQDGEKSSWNIIARHQVKTRGLGPETHDLDEADWVHVQPGDSIGIFEGLSPRAWVPYDECNKDSLPEAYGVIKSFSSETFGDFSPETTHSFLTSETCQEFSFKAVIYPNDTMPADRAMATSQVPLADRGKVGAGSCVYMTDNKHSYIPRDGFVSEWQFYAKHGGSAAFQVWRRRTDVSGERMYELIGQNPLKLTGIDPGVQKFKVPEGERIAVKEGDIIAILYDKEQLGVPYNFCKKWNNPESYNVYWYEVMTPSTAEIGKVYGFSLTGGDYLCRIFSMRAIVTPN